MEICRIGLALNKVLPVHRRFLRGFFSIAQTRPHWVLHTCSPNNDFAWEMMRRWKPQAMVGEIGLAERLGRLSDVPKIRIDLSEAPATGPVPHVGIDFVAAGELAGRFFLGKGLKHIALFSYNPVPRRSERLRIGLKRALAEQSIELMEFEWDRTPPPRPGYIDERIAQWLSGLPKPVGVVLFDDDAGLWVSQLAGVAGLRVPEEVALLGVNNDLIDIAMTRPPLSSIALPFEEAGRRAAELLAEQLEGRRVSRKPILLPPLRVVERASTDIIAINDPDVSAAVRFIREHRGRPLRVQDLLDELAISRRALERKFRAALGRSPLHEIRRAHVEYAKELLATTNLPLKKIAELSGFSRVEHFTTTLRRASGMTPGQWRRRAMTHRAE
jgi:LacI family transcriptional regulator